MISKPARRVVVLAAQVVVLTLTTSPVWPAHAASDAASDAAESGEQVSVRVTHGKLHATVRTDAGRAVALAYSEGGGWTVLDASVTSATEGGVAQLLLDLDDYADQSVTVAVITASDDSFESDLRSTEAAEIVLVDGDLYSEDEVTLGDKGEVLAVPTKPQSFESSAKLLAPVDSLKGLVVGYKGIDGGYDDVVIDKVSGGGR